MVRTTTVSRPSTYSIRLCAYDALATLAFASIAACGGGEGEGQQAIALIPASEYVAPTVVTEVETTHVGEFTGFVIPENLTYEMAESAYTAKRYGEAAAMFAVLSEAARDNPWNQYMLGLALWKSGDRVRAERAFTAAIELDPKHQKSELNLTRVLLELGRPVEALTHVEKGLAIDSTSPEAWRLVGRVNGELRQVEPALEAYRKAIVLDELDVWAMNNMGLLLIETGRFKEAIGPLARATEIRPEAPVFQNNLGMALERTGHYTAAAAAYRAALAGDSTYTRATVSLARVEGLTEDPTLTVVDLPALAANFAIDMRNRAQASVVVIEPPPPPQR